MHFETSSYLPTKSTVCLRLSGRTDFSGKRWSMLGHHTCSFDLEENGKDIFVCFPHCQDRIRFFFEIQTGSWLQRRPKSTALSLSTSNFFKHFPITEKKNRSVGMKPDLIPRDSLARHGLNLPYISREGTTVVGTR